MSDKSIRFALHGYGYIGRMHVLASQLSLAANGGPTVLWDTAVVRDMQSNAAQQASTAFAHVTDRLADLHERPLDAIDIASPNDLHFAPFELALEKGWAVYCEKPISHCLEEAERMVALAQTRQMVEQVALVYRFHPAVLEAQQWLLSGQLGRVLTFRGELLHGGYLNPARPMSWRLQKQASGGGAVMDLGIHIIDLIHLLCGKVAHVAAETRTFIPSRAGAAGMEAVDVDDWASITLHTESGAVGTIEVSRVHYGEETDSLTIVCERGVLRLPLDMYQGVTLHTYEPNIAPITLDKNQHADIFTAKFAQSTLLNLHATALAAFCARVQGKTVPYAVPTLADACVAQAVCEAALAAGSTKKQ
ncbi:Gfo/Idh/MocA family protein [Alicyclobacillus fodiniaquatilis]|uniref:Gfo/Idh/MocA family protein n=1 Tax=Alicyclobacillus fodiniaquatilis TaxID=1661150 RepID=A0ABW4JC54_9BACL